MITVTQKPPRPNPRPTKNAIQNRKIIQFFFPSRSCVFGCLSYFLFIFFPTFPPHVVYIPFSISRHSFFFFLPLPAFPVYTPPSAPAPHPPPPPLLPPRGSGSALSAPPHTRVSSSSRGSPPAAPSLPTYHEERLLPPAHKSQVHVTSTGSEHFPGPLRWEPPASLLDLTGSR